MVAALVATMAISSGARAWDDFGHMKVAAAAFKRLKPKARTRVAQLLKLNPRYVNWIVGARKSDQPRLAFLRAATWADSIKSDRDYKDDDQAAPAAGQNVGYADLLRHKYWHFIDRPFSRDGTPLVDAPAPNAATQTSVMRAALCAAATSDELKSYDLVWLLHLVGDLHQPLHCVSRFDRATPVGDRGGNLVKITGNAQPPVCDDPRYCPFGPPEDLHAFYDTIAGSGYGTREAEAAAISLPQPNAQKAAVSDVDAWVQEGLDLAQTVVYVSPINAGAGPFTVDAAYQKAAFELGKQRMSLAGARLANLINDCLGK
jgi:hypothetical protein